jgi:diaminopimelate epimerase
VEYGAVEMPLPSRIYERTFSAGGRAEIFSVVEAPGITHLLWTVDVFGDAERNFALSGIKGWCAEIGVEALGVILCSRDFGRIAPLVFVPEADSLSGKMAGGSGTAALGAFLAKEGGSLEKEVLQPGGTIRVRAECRKGILSLLQISEAFTFSEEKVLKI